MVAYKYVLNSIEYRIYNTLSYLPDVTELFYIAKGYILK